MADKPHKRRIPAKQRVSTLFHLWHSLRDIMVEARQLDDEELVLLVEMIELLIAERIAGLRGAHGGALSAADTAFPN
jgi:hypothetical protein